MPLPSSILPTGIIFIPNLRLFFLSALLIETIMILPITYKLLGVPYNNYKKV